MEKHNNQSEQKYDKKYRKLFFSTLTLSASTFGGGFVIIPFMRKKFVDELGWIEEREMMDLTAIAQSSPGAVAVNAAILIGYHVARVPGAMLTILGSVLPPLVIISVISFFYHIFRNNPIVNMAMAGLLCGVAAIILNVVINMLLFTIREKRILPLLIVLFAFVSVNFFSIHVIFIILMSGVIGAVDVLWRDKEEEGGNNK